MATMIDQEQKTLWDTAKLLIQQKDEEKAKVILKTTIDKSLRLMGVSTPIINFFNFIIPKEEALEKLQRMDEEIRKVAVDSSSSVLYEQIVDYLMLISELTEDPPMSYKKMVASIIARKSKKRVHIPSRVSALSFSPEADVKFFDESSDEYLDPIKELINQQFSEKKNNSSVTDKTYYSTSEAARKLGLSDQTIRRMCENGRFEGAYRSGGENGHWRIPEDNFITTKEQDTKADAVLKQLDKKNREAGDVDEFDL